MCLAAKEVDDVKALLDLATRDVTCRNRDGTIPRGTPRVFSTNWSWDLFWPRAALGAQHAAAIKRRLLWIDVGCDLRLPVQAVGQMRSCVWV